MSLKVLQTLVLALLVSPQVSAEQNIMVCKNIENVFSDVGHQPSDTNMSRLQGPPGKKGVPGSQGLPGLPGIQGIPGIPATVDYDRISEIIEEKVRQGLDEMNKKVEILQNNVTELLTFQEQHCTKENGLFYDGKCYILPDVSRSFDVSYEQAVQQCNNRGALVAEVHSMAHQQALQDFFQPRIPSHRNFNNLALAMVYLSSERNLRFRSGKKVSINQFRWHIGNPTGTGSNIGIQISGPSRPSTHKWFFNAATNSRLHGVICEKRI